ncbi:MAG: hypothetical protein M1826_004056 [Phylliscum demangeonii]|nr:MAG: hypothetical protein M1826_004056 [Phylliscum demangeonii]
MGLLITLPLIHLVFHGLAAFANHLQYPKRVIDLLVQILANPALEFRARLDACVLRWFAMEPCRLATHRWIQLVEQTSWQVTLLAPSPADVKALATAVDALVGRTGVFLKARSWQRGDEAGPPDADAAVETLVVAHARYLEGGSVRLRPTHWVAARCFGWGRPNLLPRMLAIPNLDALWSAPSFWTARWTEHGQAL